jgi:enamine deaminase RidA (YjgF/YER057c/UK114 family)
MRRHHKSPVVTIHAIVHGGTVYVSAQLGRGPGMTDSEAGDSEAVAAGTA